jgi:hypothetical protein
VKHRTICVEEIQNAVRIQEQLDLMDVPPFIMLKCEPFILHVHCKDLETATNLYQLAMSCGYRESGIGIGNKKIMVAVRTTSFSLELPIAKGTRMFLDSVDLAAVIVECNTRLVANFNRISRFLCALKANYSWPTFFRPQNSWTRDNDLLCRYGHVSFLAQHESCKFSGHGPVVSVGGSGGRADGSGDSRVIPLHILPLPSSSQSAQRVETLNGWSPSSKGAVHAAVAYLQCELADGVLPDTVLTERTRVCIISGGRNSPIKALPCISDVFVILSDSRKVLDSSSSLSSPSFSLRGLAYQESGQVPPPRWGHSLTRFDEDRLVLVGGRDGTHVFSDAYFLEAVRTGYQKFTLKEESGAEVHFRWTLIPAPAPQVFFHSSCSLGKSAVLLCGGLGAESLRASFVGPAVAPVDMTDNSAADLSSWVLTRCALHCKSSLGGQQKASTNISDEREELDSESLAQEVCWVRVQGPVGQRFGHTLTYLGGKCVAVVGGASFTGTETGDTEDSHPHMMEIWDMSMTLHVDGPPSVSASIKHLPINEVLNAAASTERLELGLGSLRCHHQAFFDEESRQLVVTGGGLSCAGLFGSEYCPSVLLHVCCEAELESYLQRPALPSAMSRHETATALEPSPEIPSSRATSRRKESADVLAMIVPKKRLRNVKVFLESKGWLNKSVRISEPTGLCTDGKGQDGRHEGGTGTVIECISVRNSANDDLVSYYSEEIASEAAIGLKIEDINEVMAVPVTESFVHIFTAHSEERGDSTLKARCKCSLETFNLLYALLVADVPPPVRSRSDKSVEKKQAPADSAVGPRDKDRLIQLLFVHQTFRRTKSALASVHDALTTYLTNLIPQIVRKCAKESDISELTSMLSADVPKKFEVVGDVLMICENCLHRAEWSQYFPADGYATLWEALTDCYNSRGMARESRREEATERNRRRITRVARKAEVDLGPKRESKIRLLHPCPRVHHTLLSGAQDSSDECAGPEGLGWVEVIENGINYGFDITKVM